MENVDKHPILLLIDLGLNKESLTSLRTGLARLAS